MIRSVGVEEAQQLFDSLPSTHRIATLSPRYVTVDAQRDEALTPIFVVYREGDAFWLHGVHRAPVPGTPWQDLQSAYGYGGPLANCEDSDFAARAWAAYQDWCAKESILAEFVRFHPLCENWRYYGGESRDERATVVIPLAGPDPAAGYETRCRTAVRKARNAGIETEWLDPAACAERFAGFYREGMASIGADVFYFFDDAYFASLACMPGVSLLACHLKGDWLSAGLFLRCGDTAEYHLSATTPAGRRLGATNLLIDAAAEQACAEGASRLYLGGGTDAAEDNPLFFFKRSFSALRAPYRIGHALHRPADYVALREAYRRRGVVSSRILFYR